MITDLNAIRRLLCGNSSFLVDDISINNGLVRFVGWALTGFEDSSSFSFTVNGRLVDNQKLGLSSPSLRKVFPFFPHSATSAFDCEISLSPIDRDCDLIEISLVDALFLEPLNKWHTVYYPLDSSGYKIPDLSQLQRTQGNTSKSRYLTYGFTTAYKLQKILRTYFQKDFLDFESVLDWGVGCGRVAQHIFNKVKIFRGCDIDLDNIDWCQKNLKGEFFANNLMPPLSLDSNSVDLIYGISVFSHLSGESAKAWCDELARVLRHGGISIITTHGLSGIGRILDDAKIISLANEGFDASSHDSRLDDHISALDYYRATYQSPKNMKKFFQQYFEIIDIIPGANALLQDFIVLRKI